MRVKSPREVKIGTRCATEQKEALIALLREFHEIFAWSYQDMPGLDTDIVVPQDSFEARVQARKASTAPNEARSHFEDQGRGGKAIEGRIPKHSNLFGLARRIIFLYLTLTPWSTIQQRMPCSHSWTDSQGTIRSRWPKEDKSKTAFVTHWGTFVYDVMPFGLKNAGATYQRAMVTLFHDMIHHEIEVYVDDMIAKSRTAQDHLTDLRKLFQRLKKYQLRLNPNKCAFGVTSGKLLGFIVSGRGNRDRSRKAYWRTCEPLFKLLRKDVKIKWTEDCQKAFDKIKEYLLNPPILVPPTPEFPDEDVMTVDEDNHGRWKLYFDGAANAVGSGIGAVLVSPKGQQTPIAVKLGFDCTNNMTEYEACIVGLQAALEFGAYELEVFGDSLLIVSQTNGEWQAPGSQAHPVPTIHQPASPKVQEMHAGLMGAHANGPFLARKIMRAGYYLVDNGEGLHQTCPDVPQMPDVSEQQECTSPQYLHTMGLAVAVLSAWGMDVIGAITPKASNGHEFILVAIDYFTKWVGHVPSRMLLKSRSPKVCEEQHYLPLRNARNAFNHRQCFHLNKSACHPDFRHPLELPPTLWLYGMEAVLPVEVEIPSLRILSQTQLEEAEWAQARYEQLNFIDEKRLAALCHGQLYQRRIERAYNKKARPRTFQPGDLVLKKRNMALIRSTREVRTII
uniref:Uncharacterized protein n=1 Tax=Fagus sylvatica TaxID=28930 RepID=A0A2N9HTR0_FAGSY